MRSTVDVRARTLTQADFFESVRRIYASRCQLQRLAYPAVDAPPLLTNSFTSGQVIYSVTSLSPDVSLCIFQMQRLVPQISFDTTPFTSDAARCRPRRLGHRRIRSRLLYIEAKNWGSDSVVGNYTSTSNRGGHCENYLAVSKTICNLGFCAVDSAIDQSTARQTD